jgi:hypothetical protein
MVTNTVITVLGRHETLGFAGRELSRYLRKATGRPLPVVAAGRVPPGARVLRVGLCPDLGLPTPRGLASDDDYISIAPRDGGYCIGGSNPRSVLFAVYRYLDALGFRWIRPGRRGEIVPRLRSPVARNLRIAEKATYRYRTICIEGACSFQHVRDMIDWQAKHGMNGYFIQFDYGTDFWTRWYEHKTNPFRADGPLFGPADVNAIVGKTIREIRRRDFRFERVGHGWTCAVLGLPGEGWGTHEGPIPAGRRRLLALVDGKRQLWRATPLNSNLCYSQPAVQTALVGRIVEYVKAHPEVDALHLWLADGANNNCECASCQKARPSDFLVEIMNTLDARLTDAGLKTRIVFLIYVDLLWPPERIEARIRNPDRFILMFAPITRSYLQSFASSGAGETRPFVRNRLQFPAGAAENIAYLREWRKRFPGDGFDFDYHLIWPCYYDPNQFTLARVLHADIQNLKGIGLNGLNSCQNQRHGFPHNLLPDVMARTLWNREVPFDALVTASFRDAYGRDSARVVAFFESMSALWKVFFEWIYAPHQFDFEGFGKDERRAAEGLRNLPGIRNLVSDFKPLVARNQGRHGEAVNWSWRYLAIYMDLLDLLIPAYESYLQGSPDTKGRFTAASEFLWKREPVIHPALDVFVFVNGVLNRRVAEVEHYLGIAGNRNHP